MLRLWKKGRQPAQRRGAAPDQGGRRFIVWSFLKARLQFTLDQFKGATSASEWETQTYIMSLD
jgi:hypothetical protein